MSDQPTTDSRDTDETIMRRAMAGGAAAARAIANQMRANDPAQGGVTSECYGDCRTGDPNSCPAPCKFQGRYADSRDTRAALRTLADAARGYRSAILQATGLPYPWPALELALDAADAILAAPAEQPQAEPDCWAVLTPQGSKLVSPEEAKGRAQAYPLYRAAQPQAGDRALRAEQVIALLDAGGFITPGKLEQARAIILDAHPSEPTAGTTA